jgi:hypothetical protein
MRGFFHLIFKLPDHWKACATELESQPLSTKSGSRQYEHSFSLLSYFFSWIFQCNLQRLDDFYKRNYKEYFEFVEVSIQIPICPTSVAQPTP